MQVLRRRRARNRTGPALALALVAALLAAAAPASAEETIWVCNPDADADVCRESLETTIRDPDGSERVIVPRRARHPRVDCFYVYPTVSDQPTLNANRNIDPEIESITRLQAGRFSKRCAVYAPVYRQVTVPALLTRSGEDLAAGLRIAYPDVEAAFLDYWRNDNRGKRSFVLIGHSQGAGMVIELIRRLVDDRRRMRGRMLSVIAPGVVPSVPSGRRVGGDFDHVPTCERRRQTGCVMAWATYDETPPDDTRYGIPSKRFIDAFGWESGPGLEAICTGPSSLKGNSRRLRTIFQVDQFPGLVGLAIVGLFEGDPPMADTPWLVPPDRYRGRCRHQNGAHVLRVKPIGDARDYRASPDETWGLHLIDLNIGLGNLDRIIRAQKRADRQRRR